MGPGEWGGRSDFRGVAHGQPLKGLMGNQDKMGMIGKWP